MQVGHLNQKANSPLVIFVTGCSIITTGLLWSTQKAIATGENYYGDNQNYAGYLN